jgi:hypothetical protein
VKIQRRPEHVFLTESLSIWFTSLGRNLNYDFFLVNEIDKAVITRPAASALQPVCSFSYDGGHPESGECPSCGCDSLGTDLIYVARARKATSVPISEETSRQIDKVMSEFKRLTAEVERIKSLSSTRIPQGGDLCICRRARYEHDKNGQCPDGKAYFTSQSRKHE